MTNLALRIGILIAGLAVSACGESGTRSPDGPLFRIVSGSENKSLEPVVMAFCEAQRRACEVKFEGSLDIGQRLPREVQEFDAVWPANSLWVEMYDKSRRVKHLTSVSRTPVVLGVRKSKAESLGWTTRDVTMADILAAVESGKLKFLMSSATQSNSGATAYLAMLSSALGTPDVIRPGDLDRADVLDQVKRLLAGVERTAGSSGWLAELYVKGERERAGYDAMWNYEFTIAETNAELAREGHELLWAVYPKDGIVFADSPLGFVDRGTDPSAEEFFLALKDHLLSDAIQADLVAKGRRVGLGRAEAGRPDPTWGFDPTRTLTAIPMPEGEVISKALNLYQEALRRPSFTVYCLDFSGSMQGAGEQALRQAMRLLLTPDLAAEVLIQASTRDRIIVIPFDSEPREAWAQTGEAAGQAELIAAINRQQAEGGTDMYSCAAKGLEQIRAEAGIESYLPAIVLMTDGKSDDHAGDFLAVWRQAGLDVPVFGVTFGDADKDQLVDLAEATRGRVFDGGADLVAAFRSVRGYN